MAKRDRTKESAAQLLGCLDELSFRNNPHVHIAPCCPQLLPFNLPHELIEPPRASITYAPAKAFPILTLFHLPNLGSYDSSSQHTRRALRILPGPRFANIFARMPCLGRCVLFFSLSLTLESERQAPGSDQINRTPHIKRSPTGTPQKLSVPPC